MLNIFARSFMNATRNQPMPHREPRHRGKAHWPASERFDTRERAQLEAHTHGRLRD